MVVIESVSDARARRGRRVAAAGPISQERKARQGVAEDEGEQGSTRTMLAALLQPNAVLMTIPSTSPIAQPVRQCAVALNAS